MSIISENWELSTRSNGYSSIPDTDAELIALKNINALKFRAISIGGPNGQVAIIPLDESSVERGRLASCAPEMARMLLALISSANLRELPKYEDVEDLLRRAGAIENGLKASSVSIVDHPVDPNCKTSDGRFLAVDWPGK